MGETDAVARPSSRERILDTFEQVLLDDGAGSATLDAVAERAGISKGGLIYHFPSKAALLAGLVERLMTRVDEIVAAAPDEPAELIRWYLSYDPSDPVELAVWRSLLAAIHAVDDGLAQAISDAFVRFTRPLAVLDPFLAEQVRLIGDGLYLNALVGAPPPSPEHLERIIVDLTERLGR
jgi:AcrR family transcriptional regulator